MPCVERILVVDDEEELRDAIVSMLRSAGYQCRGVAGGLEALALLEFGEEFELLTTDIMNAPMDGLTLLQRMKEEFPNIPVAVLNTVHDDAIVEACFRNGACEHLFLPCERDQLLVTVRRALEHRRLVEHHRPRHTREPDFSTGTVVFALLLNRSAIGIYASCEKAEEAREVFHREYPPANRFYEIKPFRLDGQAMIYSPY